jgi:nucleolar protein 4
MHSVRVFDDEVKAGNREALSRPEEIDDTLSPALVGKAKKKGERETAVVQSKVVRSSEKVDPLIGGGRSKGYGFLEMRSHKDALKVIRWANNNPEVGALLAEWWRGEMGEIKDRAKASLEKRRKESEGEGEGKEGGEVKSKGKEVESLEELEARVRRLEGRLTEDPIREGGMRGGKTLMIEFSIENIQVSSYVPLWKIDADLML